MPKGNIAKERKWKFKYDKDLSICSLHLDKWWHDIQVLSLLPGTRPRSAAINAYLGARYSRSSKPIWEIAEEVLEKDINPVERLEAIFAGYGHKSVGDMADIFICIENVPIYFVDKFFYLNTLIAGQARSTRYQDFSAPRFILIPPKVGDKKIREEYEEILEEEMKNYCSVLDKTKAVLKEEFNIDDKDDSSLSSRTFDTARYLLPLGLKSSFGVLMSARKWSEAIGLLSASEEIVDNEIGLMLKELLSPSKGRRKNGYIPEAAELIRHTEPDASRIESTREVVKSLKLIIPPQGEIKRSESVSKDFLFEDGIPQNEYLISNYESLVNPLGSAIEMTYENRDLVKVGEILNKYHDRNHILGNIGYSRPYLFDGFCDIGALRDMNRHRSMSRFIPLFNGVNMDNELKRKDSDCFYLCPYLYLNGASKLRKIYAESLENTYREIKQWRKSALKVMSKIVVDEYTKYLLPMAHATRYRFGADIDSLQYVADLRVRNGGHIAYRELAYSWLARASFEDPLLQGFLSDIEKPDPASKEQFVDRK